MFLHIHHSLNATSYRRTKPYRTDEKHANTSIRYYRRNRFVRVAMPHMLLFAQYASFYNIRNINYRLERVGMSRRMLEHATRTNLNRPSMDVQDTWSVSYYWSENREV